jgi:hypothetical protein
MRAKIDQCSEEKSFTKKKITFLTCLKEGREHLPRFEEKRKLSLYLPFGPEELTWFFLVDYFQL